MDHRRLDTATVFALGILDRPSPQTDIPEHRGKCSPRELGDIVAALGDERLIYVAEYYGVVCAWKDDTGYHGRLLQYRAVTERPDFDSVTSCADWTANTIRHVEG